MSNTCFDGERKGSRIWKMGFCIIVCSVWLSTSGGTYSSLKSIIFLKALAVVYTYTQLAPSLKVADG